MELLPFQLFHFMTWYSLMIGAGSKLLQRLSVCQIVIKLAAQPEFQWTVLRPWLSPAWWCQRHDSWGFRSPPEGWLCVILSLMLSTKTPAFKNTSACSFFAASRPLPIRWLNHCDLFLLKSLAATLCQSIWPPPIWFPTRKQPARWQWLHRPARGGAACDRSFGLCLGFKKIFKFRF